MADQTIKATEEMVGSGHATKSDTLNRLTLVKHNTDGTHKDNLLALEGLTGAANQIPFFTGAGAMALMGRTATMGWTQTTGTFTATPASTSTLTMTTDMTASIKAGMGLKYVIGGTTYYGRVAAITSNLLTVNGAPLGGDVTALYYGGEVIQVVIPINGAYEDATESALLATDNKMPIVWNKPTSYVVYFAVWSRVHDSGATHGAANVMVNSQAVSTSNTNTGPLVAADATWYPTVVDINTSNYDINFGEVLEIQATKGTNGDAVDLCVVVVLITP